MARADALLSGVMLGRNGPLDYTYNNLLHCYIIRALPHFRTFRPSGVQSYNSSIFGIASRSFNSAGGVLLSFLRFLTRGSVQSYRDFFVGCSVRSLRYGNEGFLEPIFENSSYSDGFLFLRIFFKGGFDKYEIYCVPLSRFSSCRVWLLESVFFRGKIFRKKQRLYIDSSLCKASGFYSGPRSQVVIRFPSFENFFYFCVVKNDSNQFLGISRAVLVRA